MKMLDLTIILICLFLVREILKDKFAKAYPTSKFLVNLIYLYPLILCIGNGKWYGIIGYLIYLSFYSYLMKGILSSYKGLKERKINLLLNSIFIGTTILFFEIISRPSYTEIKPYFLSSQLLRVFLAIILITSPTNQFFRILFSKFQAKKEDSINGDIGAGSIIGSLERMLCLIFLTMNEVGAVGLIYTAKSVARFKQIEEDKDFAEYYLIGSLYSILAAFIIFFITSTI